jgi:hypothetical protein
VVPKARIEELQRQPSRWGNTTPGQPLSATLTCKTLVKCSREITILERLRNISNGFNGYFSLRTAFDSVLISAGGGGNRVRRYRLDSNGPEKGPAMDSCEFSSHKPKDLLTN